MISIKKQKEENEPLGVGYLNGKYVLISLVTIGRVKNIYLFSQQVDGLFKKSLKPIKVLTEKGRLEKIVYCSNFSITFGHGVHTLSYLRTTPKKKEMVFASLTKDGSWKGVEETPVNDQPLHLVSHITYKGEYISYVKDKTIKIGISKNLKDWRMSALLGDPSQLQHIPKNARMFGVTNTSQGILVIYDYLDTAVKGHTLKTGAFLCAALQPYKIIWVSQMPIWTQAVKTKDELLPLGCFAKVGEIHLYWHNKAGNVFSIKLPPVFYVPDLHFSSKLEKYSHNPVIVADPKHRWESKATFNPSAIYGGGKIHLVYRAIGDNDVSMFGYASSKDGLNINSRSIQPAFFQKKIFPKKISGKPIFYSSGGSWNGGSEDPRLTMIGDKVYMLFTAFDGWSSIRIAMTSLSFDDFSHQRWNWAKPVYISAPNQINKNWVLFPEKINGKYAILHGISPEIMIAYVDNLKEFDGTKFIKSYHPDGKGYATSWDSWLRGVGPSPIKTKYGWLVFYHAMDFRDPNRYKLGAMILDYNDPTKILARSQHPILEPQERYENEGYKAGVIYACGAVVKNGMLFVYYGGADSYVCVASVNLDQFLDMVFKDKQVNLKIDKVNYE